MLKNREINGTEEIGLVTPTPIRLVPLHIKILQNPVSRERIFPTYISITGRVAFVTIYKTNKIDLLFFGQVNATHMMIGYM